MALALSCLPAFTKSLRTCLDKLAPAVRGWVVRRVATLAGSAGLDPPARIERLERLYEIAGLGKQQAYRDLHGQACDGESDELATILSADRDRTAYRIPDPPGPAAAKPLDRERIACRIRDTAEAAGLLGEIFTEPPDERTPTAATEGPGAPQRLLLQALANADWLSRSDFQALCKPVGLPVDGAIEALNELAFEAAGEALLEGTDPITVAHDVLRMLT
ncbi:MAG: hypothetical protein FJZ01_16485 [Candidatus Sericytochromatia bacterium]|nr:hypothetical protein [Candidatus Tanganyikabacteria bacterium]